MKNRKCFECGKAAAVDHPIVPASRGGTKTVPLCQPCEDKTRADAFGRIARSPEDEKKVVETIRSLHDAGLSLRKIASVLRTRGIAPSRGADHWHPSSIARMIGYAPPTKARD